MRVSEVVDHPDARGWTPWMQPGVDGAGAIELFDSFCGGQGPRCGGQGADIRLRIPKSAVDQARERRSADPIPGVIALLARGAPAIIGVIILLAPGVQTGDEGSEYPVSRGVRLGLGIPVTTLGLGLVAFGIADLAWPDVEEAIALN